MRTRRVFLSSVAAVPLMALQVGAGDQRPPDVVTYRGWTCRWMGWREPVDQLVKFGFWVARRPDQPLLRYTTTMGVSDVCHEGEVFDTTCRRGVWPSPIEAATADPVWLDALRDRAFRALCTDLDALA